jgi:hypothetical protein
VKTKKGDPDPSFSKRGREQLKINPLNYAKTLLNLLSKG